jgi:predicted Zn-dependent protease with MMP-like domain
MVAFRLRSYEEAVMTVVKEKVKVKNGVLHMNLPDEFKDKMVEVVVKIESEVAKKLMIDSIKIDTSKWKFNRDEIYG